MIDPIGASGANHTDSTLPENWNYEATVDQVETIIKQIEAGELELAEVFEQFAAAVKYLRQCDTFLQGRQQQMDLVIETLEEESDF
ncbi:MAG: exodeoxyribonuclease VII small subunit [Cyanobacteriota bacterium]